VKLVGGNDWSAFPISGNDTGLASPEQAERMTQIRQERRTTLFGSDWNFDPLISSRTVGKPNQTSQLLKPPRLSSFFGTKRLREIARQEQVIPALDSLPQLL